MVAGLDLYSAYTDPALQVITAAIRSTVYLDLGVDRHLPECGGGKYCRYW